MRCDAGLDGRQDTGSGHRREVSGFRPVDDNNLAGTTRNLYKGMNVTVDQLRTALWIAEAERDFAETLLLRLVETVDLGEMRQEVADWLNGRTS